MSEMVSHPQNPEMPTGVCEPWRCNEKTLDAAVDILPSCIARDVTMGVVICSSHVSRIHNAETATNSHARHSFRPGQVGSVIDGLASSGPGHRSLVREK